jgi:4-amino-4-deoxy-L-arabinose transferase-like glycosyltransferase
MSNPSSARAVKGALAVIIAVVLLRLFSLPFPDLIDTSEGRYASVAKLMFDKDDWVTPWIYYQGKLQPYRGKPPLHFWMMELSYSVFGAQAWSARLPSLLSAFLSGVILFFFTRRKLDTRAALAAVCIFGTSALLFFLSGACILDVTLTVGVTLALVGFALAEGSRLWSAMFFVGLGLGVLVKGPLAVALAGLTIAPWVGLRRWATGAWPVQLRSLRWIEGISVFVLIVAPWYLIQEYRNPGFLKYFIWNENLARYLVKDYGDQYGTGHKQPFGASWLMLFLGLIPWSFSVLPFFAQYPWRSASKADLKDWVSRNPWPLFGFLWMASCPFLFTFARQYTPTYFAPSIPGFAFMVAAGWHTLLLRAEWRSTWHPTICRYTVMTLGVVSLVGGLVLLRFDAPVVGVIAACVCGAGFVWWGTHRERFSEMLPSVSTLALASGLLYALVIVCLSEHISMNRSSRRALEMARRMFPQQRELTIGFAFYFPFSATFYGSIPGESTITSMPLNESEVGSAAVDAILVRGPHKSASGRGTNGSGSGEGSDKERIDNVERIARAYPERKVLGKVGRWTLFEGNTGVKPVEP